MSEGEDLLRRRDLSPSSNLLPRPIEQVFQATHAPNVHVGARRDHAELVIEPAHQRYVLGAVVVLQPAHLVEQHPVIRLLALIAVIAVASTVAHASLAEQLPNVA